MRPRTSPGESAIVEVRGPVAASAAGALYERAQTVLACDGAPELICELKGTVDLSVVDALARLQLMAQRRGARLRVRGTSTGDGVDGVDGVAALIAYLGLAGVLASRLDPGRETETGE